MIEPGTRGLQRPQQTKIWFEGLPQPVPAWTMTVPDGFMISVDLPYLRRNSKVFVSDDKGDNHQGFMTEVTLVSGRTPRLQAYIQTRTPSFEPVAEIPYMTPPDEPRATVDAGVAYEPDPEPDFSVAPDQELLQPGGDLLISSATGEWPVARPEQEQQAPRPEQEQRSPVEQSSAAAGLDDLPDAPTSIEPPRRVGGVWVWLVLLILASSGLALALHFGLFTADPAPTAAMVLPPAAPAAPVSAPPAEPVKPPQVDPPVAPPAAEPTPPAVASPAAEPAFERPPVDPVAARVWLGQYPTMVIPIQGSIKGAYSYPLKEPDALAVNLPRGKVPFVHKEYPMAEGGFRMLFVRSRKAGVHLRIFFQGAMPPYRLKIEKDAVRITLLPGK